MRDALIVFGAFVVMTFVGSGGYNLGKTLGIEQGRVIQLCFDLARMGDRSPLVIEICKEYDWYPGLQDE